jgi:hypothetical protein
VHLYTPFLRFVTTWIFDPGSAVLDPLSVSTAVLSQFISAWTASFRPPEKLEPSTTEGSEALAALDNISGNGTPYFRLLHPGQSSDQKVVDWHASN